MNFARALLCAGLFFFTVPISAVLLTSAVFPEKSGQFDHSVRSLPVPIARTEQTGSTPAVRERYRVIQVKRYGFVGSEVQRGYFSAGATTGPKRPAIVLLHGAGRDGRVMLNIWSAMMQKENLILIAPNATRRAGWNVFEDGHFVASGLLADAGRHHPIDMSQVYLVGHSMGGKFALRLANFGMGPWRAVSAHAASLWPNTIWPARRPIPLQLQVGEFDAVFSDRSVRTTGSWLTKAGHDVQMQTVKRHDHWNYDLGPELAADVWRSFSRTGRASSNHIIKPDPPTASSSH